MCLIPCKNSPNKKNKEYTRHGAVHIRGLPNRACIQVFGDTYKDARWQSTFFSLINIVKFLQSSAHGEPCKIRHYEKDSLCIFHWILWCLWLCHSQYACRTMVYFLTLINFANEIIATIFVSV